MPRAFPPKAPCNPDQAWPETAGAIRILIVEDDAFYREVLAGNWQSGFASGASPMLPRCSIP